MTKTENKILDIIKKNPLISQVEIASVIGITRSSVGVHISNLKAKGKLLGLGYIFPKNKYVSIIGGVNIDIVGYALEKINLKDSNIGSVDISIGGVARNISENLTRLDVNNYLIAPLGNDYNSKRIIKSCEEIGIDISHSFIIDGKVSSTYLAILDEDKDLLMAISDMSIIDEMPASFLEKRKNLIENSEYIVIDANLNKSCLDYLFSFDKKIIVDTVSIKKSLKFIEYLDRIFLIKPNIHELSALAGITINNDNDILKASNILISKGVQNVIVTMGKSGALYFSKCKNLKYTIEKNALVKNATGAGDAFLSAIIYALIESEKIEEAIKYGMSAAYITVESEKTVSENISIEEIEKNIKDVKYVK